MWERDEDRLALLELLEAGHLRRRTGQDEAWTLLDELPWTRRTGRRDEIELVPEHKATLVELLDRVWRGWKLGSQELAGRGLAPTPADWRRLQDLLRAEEVLGQLHEVPVVHFGDLDPAGVRIVRHLRQIHPGLKWAVPAFWGEYIEKRALPGEWPDDLDLDKAPPLIRELAARGLWLEQEFIAVDPRLRAALEAAGGA